MKRFALLAAVCAAALPVYAQNTAAGAAQPAAAQAAPDAAAAQPAPKAPQNVATVNGKVITQKSLDDFANLLIAQGSPDSPQLREQVKQEMINRQIFAQAAEKAGIAKQGAVQTEMELARQGILIRALMAQHMAKHPVTAEQVQAEYDKYKKQEAGKVEYKARHILVKEEKLARDLLAEIKADRSKFEDLAKKNSQDPGSGEKGGDLGWAPSTNYVPSFAETLSKLKKGELAMEPVQTEFGWHIIQADDTRAVEFPPLDQVKEQIEKMLSQQALADYQKSLRDAAKIQ
jgi:peptidyl-prolyl cis-trans isomerase C